MMLLHHRIDKCNEFLCQLRTGPISRPLFTEAHIYRGRSRLESCSADLYVAGPVDLYLV